MEQIKAKNGFSTLGPGLGAPGARKFREFRNFRCWWGRGPPPPTLSLPLSLALLIRLSPHLFSLLFLSRPPSSLPHMLDHSGSFGRSTGEVPSVSTRVSTGKSTEKAKRMMTHTSMCVPHQKYMLYVSYVLRVCTWYQYVCFVHSVKKESDN